MCADDVRAAKGDELTVRFTAMRYDTCEVIDMIPTTEPGYHFTVSFTQKNMKAKVSTHGKFPLVCTSYITTHPSPRLLT